MVDWLETRISYKETGAIACLALGMYCPSLRIGGTTHIKPPYVPVLDCLLSRIPKEVREDAVVVVTGVSFPQDGNANINEKSGNCEFLATYHIRNSLIRNGIRPARIRRKFSPPNAVTSLSLDPRTGLVEIRRAYPFDTKKIDEIESFYLSTEDGI